ncbi:hypothetical protein R3P38DRAFT_3193026 [Favolaschia claudopus]|uniref:Uncharacterized protein n=1 Tax=Favolaschia claudopus TaxID=2862362 RepID=A0AAW0BKU0_9AGAR
MYVPIDNRVSGITKTAETQARYHALIHSRAAYIPMHNALRASNVSHAVDTGSKIVVRRTPKSCYYPHTAAHSLSRLCPAHPITFSFVNDASIDSREAERARYVCLVIPPASSPNPRSSTTIPSLLYLLLRDSFSSLTCPPPPALPPPISTDWDEGLSGKSEVTKRTLHPDLCLPVNTSIEAAKRHIYADTVRTSSLLPAVRYRQLIIRRILVDHLHLLLLFHSLLNLTRTRAPPPP